ncbi:MFS transporter [Streptomyces beijiangensis]|uniref:MFS transporter n=1 Tax=Streptomyces beijiangensis TaxID=163361 RepID=A0A939F631_9ACTN|nr:MFS transporter [Streptomyces beijiangensis]MBO0512546.1 MFS transporter [Streptomyces beijiangensis]
MAEHAPVRSEADGDGLFSRTYAAATLSFAAVMFLTGFAALAVVPTLPVAARDLGAVPLFPLVAGCFVAASLLGGVLGGDWADRVGARRPLAAGMVLAVITLLVSATSTSIWQLAAGRFLDGISAGMVAVSINTAIGQAYPARLQPRALSLMSACWIVPSLTGPPLAGLVADWWSWRAVFYGLAALTLIPSLVVVALLRERSGTPERAARGERLPRPPLLVAAAVSVGAALAQYAVSGWDVRHLLCAAGGLAVLAVFAPRLVPTGTWHAVRGLPATVLLRGLSSGTFFTVEAFVPLLLVTERHVPPAMTGLVFTGAAIAWAASSWVQGHLLADHPRDRLVAAGALIMAVAVALAVVGTIPSTPSPVAASAMIVAAVGMGLLTPSLTLLSLAHSPADRQGYAGSAMQTSQNLGQIAILGVASAVFNAGLAIGSSELAGYGAAFGLLLVPTFLAALLASRAGHLANLHG